MADQKALNTVRYLKIAEPCIERLKHERTLNVSGDGESTAFDRLPATVAARMALRVALENGCTTIRVHQGAHRKWDFDVMDLVKATRYMCGGRLQGPTTALPPNYATLSLLQAGSTLDTFSKFVSVPSTITAFDAPALADKE